MSSSSSHLLCCLSTPTRKDTDSTEKIEEKSQKESSVNYNSQSTIKSQEVPQRWASEPPMGANQLKGMRNFVDMKEESFEDVSRGRQTEADIQIHDVTPLATTSERAQTAGESRDSHHGSQSQAKNRPKTGGPSSSREVSLNNAPGSVRGEAEILTVDDEDDVPQPFFYGTLRLPPKHVVMAPPWSLRWIMHRHCEDLWAQARIKAQREKRENQEVKSPFGRISRNVTKIVPFSRPSMDSDKDPSVTPFLKTIRSSPQLQNSTGSRNSRESPVPPKANSPLARSATTGSPRTQSAFQEDPKTPKGGRSSKTLVATHGLPPVSEIESNAQSVTLTSVESNMVQEVHSETTLDRSPHVSPRDNKVRKEGKSLEDPSNKRASTSSTSDHETPKTV